MVSIHILDKFRCRIDGILNRKIILAASSRYLQQRGMDTISSAAYDYCSKKFILNESIIVNKSTITKAVNRCGRSKNEVVALILDTWFSFGVADRSTFLDIKVIGPQSIYIQFIDGVKGTITFDNKQWEQINRDYDYVDINGATSGWIRCIGFFQGNEWTLYNDDKRRFELLDEDAYDDIVMYGGKTRHYKNVPDEEVYASQLPWTEI